MEMSSRSFTPTRLREALRAASDTRSLRIARGALDAVADDFAQHFPGLRAIVIADDRTHAAAGSRVQRALSARGLADKPPLVLPANDVAATYPFVERIAAHLRPSPHVAVAVGSGTLNDLVKLASHRVDRPYLCVATAASMDGYTAYGASITRDGSKQTFYCPAPRCVIADLGVICNAPPELNGAGYADLLAKVPAGADWILADALEIEPIDSAAWETAQGGLSEALASPGGVRRSEPAAIARLVTGLMMSGFAMQGHRTSRPASGAEHQFSHLWDMQCHTHAGRRVSHGHQVGIGSLASTWFYEQLLADDLRELDIPRLVAQWPGAEVQLRHARSAFGSAELADKAAEEVAAKHVSPDELHARFTRLRRAWPDLRERLRAHLIPSDRLATLLHDAGCPASPAEICIDAATLRRSYEQARLIRRRFTVLDLAHVIGRTERYLDRIPLLAT